MSTRCRMTMSMMVIRRDISTVISATVRWYMGRAFIIVPGGGAFIIRVPGHGGLGCAMTPGMAGRLGWTMMVTCSIAAGAGMPGLVLCGEGVMAGVMGEAGVFRVFIIRLILLRSPAIISGMNGMAVLSRLTTAGECRRGKGSLWSMGGRRMRGRLRERVHERLRERVMVDCGQAGIRRGCAVAGMRECVPAAVGIQADDLAVVEAVTPGVVIPAAARVMSVAPAGVARVGVEAVAGMSRPAAEGAGVPAAGAARAAVQPVAAVTIEDGPAHLVAGPGRAPCSARPSELRTGDAVLAAGGLLDIDQRDFDTAAALRCRRQGGHVDVIGDA